MKILFINPRVGTYMDGLSPAQIPYLRKVVEGSATLRERLRFSERSLSSLGLLTASAVARRTFPDVETDFLDENMAVFDLDAVLSGGYDLVAVGGAVYQMQRIIAVISAARAKGVPVVAGGAAVMTLPDLFQRKGVSVVLGESEVLFPRFLSDFNNGSPMPRYAPTDRDGVDLSLSPVPDFQAASAYEYSFVGVQTTRGCPNSCEFCQVSRMLGKKYRHKPVDAVVEEVRLVKSLWPEAFFFFYDDNLFAEASYAERLFCRLIEEGITLGRWGANAEASIYQQTELLSLARRLGPIEYLGIGFESLSDTSLKLIGNRTKISLRNHYSKVVEALQAQGVRIFAYFIFGFENGKKEDLDAAVDFILTHRLDAQITRLAPMPGTKLYDRLERECEDRHGPLKKNPASRWAVVRAYLLEKTGMTEIDIIKYLSDAYAAVYDDALHTDRDIIPAPFL